MILSIFRNYPLSMAVPMLIFSFFIVVFSLSFHECAHALIANALGDPTAKYRGRLSLNPMRHLDPIGTLCMLLVGFGWANPVPINPNNFKNRKGGMALSALAGPISNLLLSFIALFCEELVLTFYFKIFPATGFSYNVGELLYVFFYLAHTMNLYLAVFNLLPVPPLDGSRIVSVFLPADKYFKVMQYEKYIAIGLIILLYIGVLDGPLSFITQGVSNGMASLIELLPFFK